MKYYVYVLFDGSEPFYVGKGTGNRMYKHRQEAVSKNRNVPVHNKIRKMIAEGRDVRYEVVLRTDDAATAYNEESKHITLFGRRDLGLGPLLNLTDGGEGAVNYVFPESRKQEMSLKIKQAIAEGRYNPAKNAAAQDKSTVEYRQSRADQMTSFYDSPAGESRKRQLSQLGKQKVGLDGKRKDITEEGRRRLSEARRQANIKRAAERKHSTSQEMNDSIEQNPGYGICINITQRST